MNMTKELTFLKLVAVLASAYYLYRLTKAQGGSLQGRINTQNIANLGAHLFPAEYRPHVKQMGQAILDQMIQ